MRLYTVGYLGWKIDGLEEQLKALGDDIRVYDVRYNPYSRNPQFSRAQFISKFGDMYVHAKGFGNINYRGGPIALADPEPWYKFAIRDMKSGLPVILMCACWNLDECHRLVVSTEIEKRYSIKAEHLTMKKEVTPEKPKQRILF
jgi:uncharacterized protein (DUF488 family)